MIDSDIDDERPRSRRRRDDDDLRPRSRKRRREDETPRRKRRASPALLAGIGVGAFAMLLAVAVLIYFLVRDSSKPASNDLLVYAPTDAIILSGYDLDELGRNDAFRRALERHAPPDLVELDRAGLGSADLSRVLIARTVNNGNTCAIRFKTTPDQSKYLQAAQSGKDYAAFTSVGGNYKFGFFADNRTLILADKEPAIQALREKKKGRLSGDLQSMVDKVRGPVWRASGRMSVNDHGRLGAADDGFSLRVGPSGGTAAWLVPSGRSADVRLELEFENANQARLAVSTLKSAFLAMRATNEFGQMNLREGADPADTIDIRRGYENADVSDNGDRVSAKLQLPASEALRAVGSVRY
jgi:hypothetical protein